MLVMLLFTFCCRSGLPCGEAVHCRFMLTRLDTKSVVHCSPSSTPWDQHSLCSAMERNCHLTRCMCMLRCWWAQVTGIKEVWCFFHLELVVWSGKDETTGTGQWLESVLWIPFSTLTLLVVWHTGPAKTHLWRLAVTIPLSKCAE